MDISYTIKRRKGTRRISIRVEHTGEVFVTLPYLMPEFLAKRFVHKKAEWIRDAQARLKQKFENKTVLKQTKNNFNLYKKQALTFVTERIKHFNTFYNFKYKDIRIKNQKSRWGSCSSRGNLNFNFAIIHLPQELADYIIVHELCHLKEFNHSHRFWDEVAKTIPNHREIRNTLKEKFITIS